MPAVLFTPETAAIAGRKGRESRIAALNAAREQAELLKQAVAIVRRTAATTTEVVDYRSIRLVRVRSHLDRLDAMMETETDPQRLSQLAQAMDKVAEQERLLAGRGAPKMEESSNKAVRQGARNSIIASEERELDKPAT